MNKFEFKNLTPFKWFVLENFPFIEADFDALTEWQLFCKIGKEINQIIDSQNVVGTEMEKFSQAFVELQNYINNYFDNLDLQDEVNNKLNEMAKDGTLTKLIEDYVNPYINEQNKKIANLKQNVTEINNKVNNAVSGSPAGVYATLNELETADPDHNRIYIVSADGNWYYYKGSNWVSGGSYQSSIIANNSINKDMTNYHKLSNYNLFNKNTAIINKFINLDGKETEATDASHTYWASDYIEIDPKYGRVIMTPTTYGRGAFYDENKNFIKAFESDSTVYGLCKKIPENAKYIRFTIRDNIDDCNLNYGGYVYSCDYLVPNDHDKNYINKNVVTKTKNLNCIVDLNEVMKDFYWNEEGSLRKITVSPVIWYGVTNFIPLNNTETIYANYKFSFVSEFDENLTWLKWSVTEQKQYTPTDEKCKYITILLLRENIDKITFSKTSTPTSRIPLYIPDIEDNSITLNMLNEDIINHLSVLEKYSGLKNKKITFLGDSITYGYNGAEPGNRVDHPYPSLVQELTKCISTNSGINGSTITGDGSNLGYVPINNRIKKVDVNQDYLIIFAGTNDYGGNCPIGDINDNTNDTLYGSLDIIFKYYYDNLYSHMKVGFITPIQKLNGRTYKNTTGKNLTDYVDAIKTMCDKYSIPVLDLYNSGLIYPDNSNFKKNFLPDGLHPNQALYNKMSIQIANFLNNL